jgi:hypothetical protein
MKSQDTAAGPEPAVEAAAPAAGIKIEGLRMLIETWFAEWYPETSPANHPAPPFSGARSHARAAAEDLKARLSLV